jgi:N-acetylmuramoyl-L-alanine amidase
MSDANEQREPPASVIFMEMMRRAAADQNQEPIPDDVIEAIAQEIPPMSEAELRRRATLEAQKIRRLRRRRQKRQKRRSGMLSGFIFSWFIVVVSGGLIATILSWSTSPDSLPSDLRAQVGRVGTPDVQNVSGNNAPAAVPTAIPTPNYMIRIGIVSGHMGPENDPGATCPDGLTENEINFAVAQRVWRTLRERGYTVDLLEEFDVRLDDYQANALVSIHANDCRDYGEPVSGFLVSQAEARPTDGPDAFLMECIATAYGQSTGLPQRFGLTRDMTDYHIFREIHINTPGVILELGFMRDDREILTTQPDLLAQAIVDGISCYLNPDAPGLEAVPSPAPTLTANPTGESNE